MKLKKSKTILLGCVAAGIVVLGGISIFLSGRQKSNDDFKKTDYGSASDVVSVTPDDGNTNGESDTATVVKNTPDFTKIKIGGKPYTLGQSTYNDLYINGWILNEFGQSDYKDFMMLTNADDGTFLYTKLQTSNVSQDDDSSRKLYGIYQTADESVCRDINVCGVTIGSSLDDVLKKLGNPKTTNEDSELHQTTLEYVYGSSTMDIVVATQSKDVSNTANSANAGSGSTNEVLQAETGVISIMITMPEDTTATVTATK